MAHVPVYFLCISALEIVNCWTHHSSVCLDGLEHDPCVVSWVLTVPSVRIMYAARVHVRRDTLACLCLMCRLCPTEAIDQDPCNPSRGAVIYKGAMFKRVDCEVEVTL